ncbi:ankyrin repeat and SOCS box protein 1-like isoform X1 [Lineus longissimus]|uniref:ankyrin repeat and SOCS box protein 1-like isoform X1 n=1 Tax=Lineus longissimus TaxID=88925 RepID=UPI002B4F86A8
MSVRLDDYITSKMINVLNSLNFANRVLETDSPLHVAAHEGDLKTVKRILEVDRNRENLSQKNRLGCTPLRLAATAGHAEVVEYLVLQGADVDIVDIKCQTSLYMAVKHKHLECIKILLRAGANPNGDLMSLCTPLYIAAMDGYFDGVLALIKSGVDLNLSQISIGSFISTPLYITVVYKHYDCFRVLVIAGADPDFNKKTGAQYKRLPCCQSLYHAVMRYGCDIRYAQLLYECGTDLNSRDDNGRLAHELDGSEDVKNYLKEMSEQPRPLMSSCRLFTRKVLNASRTIERNSKIEQLPLPNKLKNYLNYVF